MILQYETMYCLDVLYWTPVYCYKSGIISAHSDRITGGLMLCLEWYPSAEGIALVFTDLPKVKIKLKVLIY